MGLHLDIGSSIKKLCHQVVSLLAAQLVDKKLGKLILVEGNSRIERLTCGIIGSRLSYIQKER